MNVHGSNLAGGAMSWSSAEINFPECSVEWDICSGQERVGTFRNGVPDGPWLHYSWDDSQTLMSVFTNKYGQLDVAMWLGAGSGWIFREDTARISFSEVLYPRKVFEKQLKEISDAGKVKDSSERQLDAAS